MSAENIEKFADLFRASLVERTFVKLTLSNYRGEDEQLQKVRVRAIETKKGRRLNFQYTYATRDVSRNIDAAAAQAAVTELLRSGFRNAHLFTTAADHQLDIGKRNSRLTEGKPAFTHLPELSHDRTKRTQVDPDAFYLKALGITNDAGAVRARQGDKWKQINKFVEILGGLFERSLISGSKQLTAVDMGSGKGYLTFAAYDYFANTLGLNTTMTGVDTRPDMIELCNSVSDACGFDGLKFVCGSIADHDPGTVDILIALHACDTATDDAIFKGIIAKASIIVAAPCCHKEVRRQMKAPRMFSDLLKHGTLLERTAETVTDGLRSMLLERSGYGAKVFEFVAAEHTPKNNMIVGVKSQGLPEPAGLDREIQAIKDFYSIRELRLETLLDRGITAASGGGQP